VRPLYIRHSLPVLLLAFATTLSSCWGFYGDRNPPEYVVAEAYVPIYGYDAARYTITSRPAQPTVNAGKIYVWGNTLFQVEQFEGVHLIDYSDRKNPVKLGFIAIKGCADVTVKGDFLLTNNMQDLVTIDISNRSDAKEVSRVKGAFFAYIAPEFSKPDKHNVHYVCPDQSKGDVIGWKLEKKVKNAWCYNN